MNEKIIQEQKALIQGYIPVITIQGIENYVKLNGKLTTDFMEAYCTDEKNALKIATSKSKDIGTPSVLPINGLCKIVR